MIQTILLVGSGGFIGSVLRYLIQHFMERNLESIFPWGTLIANISGSFILGIIFALAEKGNLLNSEWRIFLAVGFCGGFTTFSTFAHNNYILMKEEAFSELFLNIGANLLIGILAIYAGIMIVRFIS